MYGARINGGRGSRAENKYMKMRGTDKTERMEAEHPVVRTHPETGHQRRVMWRLPVGAELPV